MTSIILGLITVALGVFGVLHWMTDFLGVLKGLVPLSFICGGIVAIFAGISSLRNK